VILHPAEEGGYWSEVPALPGCCSQGETLDEAVANTRLAIDGWIDYLRGRGEPLPSSGDLVVSLEVVA
jgi:predicted RNase H-like HicB family nuclease